MPKPCNGLNSTKPRPYNICLYRNTWAACWCCISATQSCSLTCFYCNCSLTLSKMVAREGCWFIFQSQDWPYLCANELSNYLFKEMCNLLRNRFKCVLYNIATGWFVNGGCSGGKREIKIMNHYPDEVQKQFKIHFIITDVCQINPSSTSCRLWFLWSLQVLSFATPTITFAVWLEKK